jgi:DNA-binding XRE family transcriptional regulator
MGAKMYKQSFRLAFAGEMVVTNTTFVLEKFLINVFPLKDFLNFYFNTNLTKQGRERIGELVKVLRNNSGKSQKELAFKVGVSLARISQLEKGTIRLSSRHVDIYPRLF